MEKTTNNNDFNNYESANISGMELEFYEAAMNGNIDPFKGMGEQIESILTPNKNTILHIHFTNYTDNVSKIFVEEVLRICPTLVLKTNVKDETILHIAARYGHHQIVKNLIECAKVLPKDINEVKAEKTLVRAKNDKKDTALHEAVRYGHEEVVDVLIQEESDHSHFGKNIDDETPLYLAVERQYWKVVDAILDNISSPQYTGPNGRSALHAAVLHGDIEIVLKLLTRISSAAKEADENGWVPLHLVALLGRSSHVVELLLSKDRSTAYMRDNKGRTALHLAAFRGDTIVMDKILKYCPDCCELVDEKGNSALHYTTMHESDPLYYGLEEIMKDYPLISIMCNEKDDDGNTPLHLLAHRAPEWKSSCYHDLLTPHLPRVDKMAFNKYGQTVLDVAVAHVPQHLSYKNTMLSKLQNIGARLGGRVPHKRLREKKQEKIHGASNTVDEAEEQYEKCKKDSLGGVATTVSVVAILITTVTFTAAFTLPGGLFQDGKHKGSPILKYNAAFITFVITDSLSFLLSASAVFLLFWSSMIGTMEERIFKKVSSSLVGMSALLTMAAMGFMVIAFGTGIYAVLGVSKGFGVVTLLIVLSFFFVVFFIYFWRTIVTEKQNDPDDGSISYYYGNYNLERISDFQLSFTL